SLDSSDLLGQMPGIRMAIARVEETWLFAVDDAIVGVQVWNRVNRSLVERRNEGNRSAQGWTGGSAFFGHGRSSLKRVMLALCGATRLWSIRESDKIPQRLRRERRGMDAEDVALCVTRRSLRFGGK